MSARITLDFDGDDATAVEELTRGVDLGTLLRDALGEFVATRSKTREYVAARYKNHTEAFQVHKLREVKKRCKLAEVLKRSAVTIETSHGGVFSDLRIPADWPVQPLGPDDAAVARATCGTCGLSWDDGKSTSLTPTPGARCPFEPFHCTCPACNLVRSSVEEVR